MNNNDFRDFARRSDLLRAFDALAGEDGKLSIQAIRGVIMSTPSTLVRCRDCKVRDERCVFHVYHEIEKRFGCEVTDFSRVMEFYFCCSGEMDDGGKKDVVS